MPWNPEKYNQFKTIRYQPFFDLMEFLTEDHMENAIDIGCGTGEQTSILSQRFDKAQFLGIDPSAEMLSKSEEFKSNSLRFEQLTVEEFLISKTDKTWDLIFSNAALQWSENHPELFPALITRLSEKGQFAVQMPVQPENLLNKILIELIQEKPFSDFLNNYIRESPVLPIDDYAQIMFDGGLQNIQILQKVYPIVAEGPEVLLDFISGSTLIPYMERMKESEQNLLLTEFNVRIQSAFKRFPAMYAFKRFLLYGNKLQP